MFEVDRWDPSASTSGFATTPRNPLPVVVLQRTFGTDVGYNGFDLMLEDGVLEARFYRVWPGNAHRRACAKPIARDEWQHVAVTYDGSSTAAGLRLYPRRRRAADDSPPRPHAEDGHRCRSSAPGSLTLGERFRDRGFKDGEIDELRIYDRALTPLEVRNLHDGKSLAAALADPQSHRDELERILLLGHRRRQRATLRSKLRDARRQLVEAEEPMQEVPVMAELPEPRPTYILARGAYDAPKTDANRVERDTFENILIPFPDRRAAKSPGPGPAGSPIRAIRSRPACS